ncbi:hypothetical protein VP01_2357g1 [Puccinia sorghi]|uniref:Uncharacterized protein n=1 Tax=Puccinia sorghi TaxID=27349 RepID=A0A0L6V798_9BASI|nr:hypothetical protein VP01_2357g1 [Puccinia sorghi]
MDEQKTVRPAPVCVSHPADSLQPHLNTTLKKLAELVKNKFYIEVSPGAIQKTLKKIEVTWKTVTPIPHKWNEAAFLQEQHYVLN